MTQLLHLLGSDVRKMLTEHPERLAELIDEVHEEDFAEYCKSLDLADAVALLRSLPEELAAGVLERIEDDQRNQILGAMQVGEAASLLAEMSPDDAADAVQEMEQPFRQSIMAELDREDPDLASEVRELASYDEGSAGGIMTTAFVGLPPETKVWKAIDEVRRASHAGEAEMIYYVYVMAYGETLVGVCSLRDLILADPSQELADIMTESVVRVRLADAQEDVARVIAKYDFHAVPVVDLQGQMQGVVTVDDVVDVVIEEATEDAQLMGAVSPMEDSYFATRFWSYFRSRVVWLVVLFLGGFLTAEVMSKFQDRLSHAISLAIFIPLIISTGGNAGSQSATLVIRALAIDEVRPSDWVKVMVRELLIGLFLGLAVGSLGFLRALLFGDAANALEFAITVSVSILSVVTVGALVGSLLPLLMYKLGLDPAVSSTPFIASLSDVVGLIIYFTIATMLMGV